jgi:hypothetical protein
MPGDKMVILNPNTNGNGITGNMVVDMAMGRDLK